MDKINKSEARRLREKSEKILGRRPTDRPIKFTDTDTLRLIHELEVHQIELELQNEELQLAKAASQKLTQKYSDLYNFAPVGYFTLSKTGVILDLNLTAATMLDENGFMAVRNNFVTCLSESSKPFFYTFLNEVFQSNEKQSCEVILSGKATKEVYLSLSGITLQKNETCLVTANNITKRKLAENATFESEERLRSAILNSPIPIMIHDEDGLVLLLSQGWTTYSGYNIDDIPTLADWTQYAYGERTGIKKDYIDSLFAINETVENGEWTIRTKDGAQRIWKFQTTPLGRVHSSKRVLQSLAIDITDQKMLQDELISSKNLYQTLFENDLTADYIKNSEGEILLCNQAFASTFGYSSSEEVIGTNMSDFCVNKEEQLSMLNTIRTKGKLDNHECWFKRKDGKLIHIIQNAIGRFDGTGVLQEVTGYMFDDTDRKLAEEAVANERTMLRTLIDNLPDAIYIKDATCRKLLANIPDLKNIGASNMEEVIGKTDLELFPGEIGERGYADDMSIIRTGKPIINREEHFKNTNGKIIWYLTSKIPIFDEQGNISGLVGIGRDITDKKVTEEALIRAKEKAEESDRLKSAFLANMSHEIRTPMNGILGFTEMLKDQELSSQDQKSYINIIEKSGLRLLNIINDVVDISKIESGQMKVYMSSGSIFEQLNYVYELFKTEAEKHNIVLRLTTSLNDAEAIMHTDHEKIYAILINLIKNALKFTTEGFIEFGCKKKGNAIEFFVKDTGKGIPKSQQEVIFERFRQGSELHTRNYEGAGLGLSISRAYVEMLGGKIWLESKENRGTTFFFTIPTETNRGDTKAAKPKIGVRPMVPSTKKLRILIAEDDEISRMLLHKKVELFSEKVYSAGNGREAVEICRDNPDIDLILMDIKMPEMDGYESTRQIRTFNKTVTIIAQSAFAFASDEKKAIMAGCNAFISKPIDGVKLIRLIRKCCIKVDSKG